MPEPQPHIVGLWDSADLKAAAAKAKTQKGGVWGLLRRARKASKHSRAASSTCDKGKGLIDVQTNMEVERDPLLDCYPLHRALWSFHANLGQGLPRI